jgi:putative copper resistance protein D
MSLLTTVQQLLLFSATVLATGCVAWRLVVAPRAAADVGTGAGDVARSAEERIRVVAMVAAVGVVLGWLMRGGVQLMAFRDPFVPISEDIDLLLFQTVWGTVWMVQGAVALVLAGLVAATARAAMAWKGTALLVVALAGTLAASGHAMGAESGRGIAVTADALHVLTAGSWIGTLAVILIGPRPTDSGPAFFAAQLRRFSPLALVSGATLVAMGFVLSWTHLTAVSDLWTTGYGRTLSAKAGLAFVVLGLGAVNWQRGLPVLDSPEGAAAVHRRAAVEVAVAFGVLVLTAVLVHSTKP